MAMMRLLLFATTTEIFLLILIHEKGIPRSYVYIFVTYNLQALSGKKAFYGTKNRILWPRKFFPQSPSSLLYFFSSLTVNHCHQNLPRNLKHFIRAKKKKIPSVSLERSLYSFLRKNSTILMCFPGIPGESDETSLSS